MLAVFNQTWPGPPPEACAIVEVLEVVAGDDCAAAGVEATAGFEVVVGSDLALTAGVEVEVETDFAPVDAVAELAGAPYQSFTPLCPRQAPCLLAPV